MRESSTPEIVGLKWTDVKPEQIILKRSINVHSDETTGKNDNARRTFALTSIALDILNNQKAKLAELGIKSEFVFPNEGGSFIPQSTYYKRWVRYRDRLGLSQASPYELRHTFVSIIKTLPEGVIKPLVGHSKDMDTFGTYSHEVKGDQLTAAGLVQSIFDQILNKVD